ncbi:MAG: NnrS family protein [Alphaproteobacteria bacterium]|nr:MAG: NnrS family protein [Alphaproteobacteria bacterium]
MRRYTGPAILSYGFRPLFLLACLWAALAMGLWVVLLAGGQSLPTHFDPISWHVHEFLFGYLSAVMAGFLLTAVPNWTGRLPVTGRRLLVLVLAWVAGRLAVLFSAQIGASLTALVDLSFLALFGFVMAREIVAGKNWRNLKVLILVGLFLAGNGLFHLEAMGGASASQGIGARMGVGVAILLIMVIGGRIVPSFTRNWLARRPGVRMPAPFDRFDGISIGISAAALAIWCLRPDWAPLGWLLLAAGTLQSVRLARWAGDRTWAEPLVVILHLGYGFVPLGFFLTGLAALCPDFMTASAALHAWTAGAIGVMTLAVMTRASLGHVGRPLAATPGIQLIYALSVLAALARIASGVPGAPEFLLYGSAALWIGAFAAFVVIYGPLLMRPRGS